MTEEKSEVTRRAPPKVRKSVSFSKDTKDNEKVSDVTRFLLTENPYILSGFREYTECSFFECAKSTCHIHNDTMNIWTHLIGAMWAIVQGYYVLTWPTYSSAHFFDKLVFLFFLFCTCLCFFASSAYHIFRSHSVRMFHVFLVADVGSIALQLFGTITLIAYLELQCYPTLRVWWMLGMFGWFLVSIISVPYLLKRKMTSTRTFLLTTFSLSALVANATATYLRDFSWNENHTFVFTHLIACYCFSGVGLVIRRIKFPEVFSPGSFDIWFGSHQIFHMCVVMGPVSILRGYSTFLLSPPTCIL